MNSERLNKALNHPLWKNHTLSSLYKDDKKYDDIEQIRNEFKTLWEKYNKGEIDYNEIDQEMKKNKVYWREAIDMTTGE